MIVGALVILVLAVYGIARMGSQGKILGSVTVLDVEIGGLSPQEARASLDELEERLANLPAPVLVANARVDLIPIETGFELDHNSIVAEALAVGRSDNPLSDFFWWLGRLFSSTTIDPSGRVDPNSLDEVLRALDISIIGEPPFDGAVEIRESELVAVYPRPGRRISRLESQELLIDQFLTLNRSEVELPVREEQPELTERDIDLALDEANLMLSGPITLTAENGTALTFTVEHLRSAFLAETLSRPARIEFGFDPEVIDGHLAAVRADFEAEAVDARFTISGYEVSIVQGSPGTLLDAEETARVLADASRTSLRRSTLPLREGAEPEITTEYLESLDIRHLVAQFTTYHDCCQPRVTNIHTIAAAVDGAIVAPGAQFSLNDHVGERTAEKGYLDAGTIVGGEIVDTVGGGVSQFATTFYNAVFWGGYEDIDHRPHTFYFDRYPEGIEATISWPQPNLVFRNGDSSGILIKTEYSDTAITVKFYGNNDGRILSGQQSGGSLAVGVVAEGGSDARRVQGDRSDREDFRDPPTTMYRPNPDLKVEQQRVAQSAVQGWSLTVTRTITVRGETTSQNWPVRYLPRQEIIEVHPCRVPGATETCPTTTTTTVPDTTTTTEPTDTTSTTVPPDTTSTITPPDSPPTTEPDDD
ncbi:VanW family protein [soil metagenome]